MNTEEIKAVVRNLRDVIGIIEAETHRNDRRSYLLCLLNNAWANLDRHWLAMEVAAAETSPAKCDSCAVELCGHGRLLCPACCEAAQVEPAQWPDERLDAIEERLAEIEREAKELVRVYVRHIEKLHAVAKPLGEPIMTPEEATQSPPSSG